MLVVELSESACECAQDQGGQDIAERAVVFIGSVSEMRRAPCVFPTDEGNLLLRGFWHNETS